MSSLVQSSYKKHTVFWLFAFFAAANFIWLFLRPLAPIPHDALPSLELSKAALRYKAERLKASSISPKVLIIGSSLPMSAFFYCEAPPFFDTEEGARIRSLELNLLQAYPKANYFCSKLEKAYGRLFSVFNFAGAACMASDTRLVMNQVFGAGKKPELIIYGVGLRDFNDNVNSPPGETPYWKSLCDFSFLSGNLSFASKLPAFSELLLSSICSLYDRRLEYRLAAEHIVCRAFNHPSSAQIAFMIGDYNRKIAREKAAEREKQDLEAEEPSDSSESKADASAKLTETGSAGKSLSPNRESKPELKQTENAVQTAKPLGELDYKARYSPANYKQLNAEMQELKRLVSTCKDKGIKLVLVNMPVSKGHVNLSPEGLRQAYLANLRKVAASANLFVDFEGSNYPDSYFFDTVHLNPLGAAAFIDRLVTDLRKSKLLD